MTVPAGASATAGVDGAAATGAGCAGATKAGVDTAGAGVYPVPVEDPDGGVPAPMVSR